MTRLRPTFRFLLPAAILLAALATWWSTAGIRPSRAPDSAIPGATIERAGADGASGVVITSLRSDGAASAAGLQVGDRIDRIDGLPAQTKQAVGRAIARAASRPLDIRVWRRGHIQEIRVNPNPGA